MGTRGVEEESKILLFLKKKKQKDFLLADAPSRPIAAY
jgi:hypothetical protein